MTATYDAASSGSTADADDGDDYAAMAADDAGGIDVDAVERDGVADELWTDRARARTSRGPDRPRRDEAEGDGHDEDHPQLHRPGHGEGPSTSASIADAIRVTTRRRRVSTRSTTTPPSAPKNVTGRNWQAVTRPSIVLLPVSWRTSHPWATVLIHVPAREIAWPPKYNWKFLEWRSEAKALLPLIELTSRPSSASADSSGNAACRVARCPVGRLARRWRRYAVRSLRRALSLARPVLVRATNVTRRSCGSTVRRTRLGWSRGCR